MSHSSKSSARSAGQRRLEQAIEYVARTWFPANPEVLERIHHRSTSGKYQDNFDLLLYDLKSDFAVFSFLLKEMRGLYPNVASAADPIEMMRSMDLDALLKLITIPSDAISSHSFQEMEKTQASRLKHLMWSCSTSEILADKTGETVNAGQVFTYSVVRQLGLNLIAWNYPSIYGRVVQSLKEGAEGELDQLLLAQLGFEPIELAAALTFPEQLGDELSSILGLPGETREQELESDDVAMQKKLCEIGEAFAILNDPETFPTGTPAARTSIQEIEDILGPGGAETIVRSIKSRYVSYLTLKPDLLNLDAKSRDAGRHGNNPYGKMLFTRNQFAARLSEDFRERLANVYSKVMKGQVSTEGIQFLVSELIPFAGFNKGCIFLLEQKELTLTPRLRIGDDRLGRYKPVSAMDSGLIANPIAEAFYASFPVKQTGAVFLGESVSLIAGVLGVSERAGVLYLEMTESLASSTKVDPVTTFKAIRQCMNDCLNLR